MRPYYEDASGIIIYHGDCREVTEWLAGDVLVTDPPYGTAHVSGGGPRGAAPWKGKRAIAGDDDTSLRDEALSRWGTRPALVFGSWKRQRPSATRMVLIWDKGPASGMGDLSLPWKPNTEEIYVLGTGFSGYRGSSVLADHTVVGQVSWGRLHPNQKPTGLMSRLIEKCPEGVIVDPFMGSGATLRAAKDRGRKAIGVELDERYCEIAAERMCQTVLDFGMVS